MGSTVTPALLLPADPPRIVWNGLLHFLKVRQKMADAAAEKEREKRGKK